MRDFVDYVKAAVAVKASDLHLNAGYPPSMRVDGGIVPISDDILTDEECTELASQIMNPRLKEKLNEFGEVDFAYAVNGLVRLRMNVYQATGSVAIVGRILNDHIPEISELGLPEALIAMREKRRGLILVTGITGSGKSTTLASLVQSMNVLYDYHIITIEEPVEYIYPRGKSMISQREIGSDSLSFANALRAALRQDPDVILVGEMRDLETIQTAVSAAETGHLVLSTLHTVNTSGAVDRIVDVFPTHQQQQIRAQLADVLECVVSQQLIPRQDKKGRVVATELMICNSAIRNHIREGKTFQIPNDIVTARRQGMHLMDDSILDLYQRYIISAENALSYALDKEEMSKKVLSF